MSVKFYRLKGTEIRQVRSVDMTSGEESNLGLLGTVNDFMDKGVITEVISNTLKNDWIFVSADEVEEGVGASIGYESLREAKAAIRERYDGE